MTIYNSFIHKASKKSEAKEMSFNKSMDKQTVAYPQKRILFRDKEK